MNYHKYEKTVFDWFSKKKPNNNFTFSVRRKASKGSELDYFIGTEKSNYFGMTFWTIPVGFPGSASDLIDLFFTKNKESYYFYFQFYQTNTPHDEQNKLALELIRSLKPTFKKKYSDSFYEAKSEKYERYSFLWGSSKSGSVDELLEKLDKELSKVVELVNKEILKFTNKYIDFTAHPISQNEFQSLIDKMEHRFEKHKNKIDDDDSENPIGNNTTSEKVNIKQKANNIYDLNTILYGPPGTGKTYNTVLRAAEIIENRKIDDYDEAKRIFKENLHNRIEFITFHQNYSYEDFIQGLRPDLENNNLRFDRADGVFKKITDRALGKSKLPVGTELKDYIVVKSNSDIIELKRKKDGTIRYVPPLLISDLLNGISDGKITLDQIQNRRNQDQHLADIIESKVEKYYFGIDSTIYQICTYLLDNTTTKQTGNYVIVIDEINRANISRVFGELITLIEPDKRSHGEIPMEARLPSGDKFIVPSNLYIIGTMNTADKSIALLDIALRRRFEFEAMYPKYEIIGHDVYDKEILFKINEQIIKSKGYDFQIGHAYFMGENNDLVKRMNKKVIPLLLEYYMNDEKEVKSILTNAGLELEENSWPLRITGKRD